MTAFSAAVDALFADVNMAAEAIYTLVRTGEVLTVRVIRRAPDEVRDFGGNSLWSDTAVFDVRVSDVAAPEEGDRIVIGNETRVVQGKPERDSERLVWRLDTRAVT